ncbi:MAG TPA: alcohol dehydrogenase catalytic domain-containing protein [Terriglobia bacterium]|nr:alcohol dehydrogenase catalytic domain-containing protein [Terriglobia bacterium]
MQAGVYSGVEKLTLQEWPKPELNSGEMLVKVRYAGICGTDMMIHAGKHPRVVPPRVLGHEIFGTVVETRGATGSKIKEGNRVAVFPLISCGRCAPCREGNAHVCEKLGLIGIDTDGGFAEYVKAVPEQLIPVPPGVDDEQAALIEPLSVAVHVVRTSGFIAGDTALVTGAGPIGNLIAQVLRAVGARRVLVSEAKPFRRNLAEGMGFTVVNPTETKPLEAIRSLTGESFADHVFEATGAKAAYQDAIESCKVHGHITFVGLPKLPPELDVLSLVFKEIRTSGARVYTPKDFLVAISLLERGAIDVKSVVTDRLPLKDIEEGLRKMHDPDSSLKILFNL